MSDIAFSIRVYLRLSAVALMACVQLAGAAERAARPTPEAGPLEKRAPVAPPGAQIWVVGSNPADLDVIRTERGEIFLAAGKTLILIDPSNPSLQVEVRARDYEPLYLGSIIALSRQRGIYAGLAGQRGQADAGTAIEGPNGVIVFKVVPAGRPERETVAAARAAPAPTQPAPPKIAAAKPVPPPPPVGTSELVEPLPVGAPPASAAAPVPEKVAIVEPLKPVPDTAPEVVVAATSGVASASRSEPDSYAGAMRALVERQGGGGVRSVSELTRVHPAVDLLRRMK